MDLGSFHALVKQTLNRGDTLDARIPAQVQMAVQWMERNYTFSYMERFRLLQLVALDRTVRLPSNSVVKGFRFVRFVNTDGSYGYVKKVQPEDVGSLPVNDPSTRMPAVYWTVANSVLVFGAVPQTDLNGEAMWYEYTDWPQPDSSRHPLLTMATDLVLAQTLMNMASFVLRDMRMVAAWKELRDEGVNTLTRAEDETKYSGESFSMAYGPQSVV